MNSAPEVVCEALSRRFPNGVCALDKISFRVPSGGLTAIIGPSGCGKTTLLRIAARLDQSTEGQIRCVSRDGTPMLPRAGQLAVCFQEARLLPWRTALENVALPLELAGVDRAERRMRANRVIHAAGLDGAQQRMPAQLSGGMRMRVALARALVTQPSVLLLDEPCSSVDEFTRMQLDEEIRRLWQASGATTILVTHSVSEAVFLADTIIVMEHGRVHATHTVELPQGGRDRTSLAFSQEVEFIMRTLACAAGVARR